MITATAYVELRSRLAADGWVDEYLWSENVQPPVNADSFFSEYAWVVISSGIKNQVARVIWDRVQVALADGKPVLSAYRHPGKAAAIQLISDERAFYFDGYQAADDKIAFIADLPGSDRSRSGT